MNETILDTLTTSLNCFISDLRVEERQRPVFEILQKTPIEEYSLEEWEETLGYLFHQKISMTSLNDVKQFLRQK